MSGSSRSPNPSPETPSSSPASSSRRARSHRYETTVTWTGNEGAGTASYSGYRRDHVIVAGAAPPLPGSSDPGFRGDAGRYNPEQLLVAALSACHMLWYLHLCSAAGVAVVAYEDSAEGVMGEDAAGSGRFTEVTLRPRVGLADERERVRAEELHEAAHRMCFIANSVTFPVRCQPRRA
jgi:organic hydroperoxide reductase OsmC/OhrA